MSLFRNKKPALPDLITQADFDDVASYGSALTFLIGLSDDDYTKATKVAEIHRKAYQDAAAVLGDANEPTTFINPPELELPPDEPDFLSDDKPKKKVK